jgi:hypothetical protein
MTLSQVSVVIQSAFGVMVLLIALLFLIPSLRLDIFRQGMFSLRDELFDYASSGKIAFDHPSYRLLRRSMNGFIRYGHRLTFFQLCITFCRWRWSESKPATSWARRWEAALSSIEDEQVKIDLEKFHSRSMELVVSRLIFGSPLLLATVLCLTVVLALTFFLRGAWRSTAELYSMAVGRTFKVFAIDNGALEDEALRNAA